MTNSSVLCTIGGPGTWLPRIVESCLSWMLAVSCLGVSGYYYMVQNLLCVETSPQLPQLMTHSRTEYLTNANVRWGQLEAYLQYCDRTTTEPTTKTAGDLAWIDDDDALVQLIRTDDILRRLVSIVGLLTTTTAANAQRQLQLRRIWPRLLPVDDPVSPPTSTTTTISLIVPCYRENMHHVIHHTLAHAVSVCQAPEGIQLILVQAAEDEEAASGEMETTLQRQGWGQVQLLTFSDGTGRGPCLNYGANAASGEILSFCHSDTKLPDRWDVFVKEAFGRSGKPPIACAFAFGIDDSGSQPLPPGIRAVEVTANLRCKFWSLPYGDQCLSIPKATFDYVGGFPHQCIMEDYELIVLLRARGHVETLRATALCSPRRWMKLGVLCVTYTNSYLVKRYKGGTSPEDIYNQYYSNGTMKVDPKSPWEVSLEQLIGSSFK